VRDELQYPGHAPLHVVHARAVRVHVARFAGFSHARPQSVIVIPVEGGSAVRVRRAVEMRFFGGAARRGGTGGGVLGVLIPAHAAFAGGGSAGFLVVGGFRGGGEEVLGGVGF